MLQVREIREVREKSGEKNRTGNQGKVRESGLKGKVKHYFKSLVNDPSESDESINSETDDCLLNLPDI
ncbi:hypothetical protein J6590_000982 [Homalodisca vitripennis]|nr:hypothetical protein J6590_000982 [Homalodisca vitripennis]